MDKNELRNLLGIKPSTNKGLTPEEWHAFVDDDVNVNDLRPTGPTSFDLDEWEIEEGSKIPREQVYSSEKIVGYWQKVSDLFAAAYRQYPTIQFKNEDELFHNFITTLLETPDFQVLHESTRANLLYSRMAAVEFANQFAQLQRKTEEALQTVSKGTKGKDPQAEKDAADMACLAAVNAALQAAAAEVEQIEDIERSLGPGESKDDTMSLDRVKEIFNRVKNSTQLKRICELAGRYRRAAQAKQRQKTSHGYDEMVGVELSGDVGRLLPSELAQLGDEDLELDAMRRLVERQSMSREYRGVEKQAKGPIVVVVDESGSMRGEPVAQAKAFALSMYWVAKHQNRYCCLVGFAGGTQGTYCVIPPGKDKMDELTQWLEHFYSGGTKCDVPLVELPARWDSLGCPKGKTDIICITDAQVRVPQDIINTFNAFKSKEKAKLTTIVIGADAGDMRAVSDECFHVSGIALDQEAVSKCMSI